MKKIINYFILLLCILYSGNAFADKPDDCKDDDIRPECLFDIGEGGEVTTRDGEAERTFSFPPIKTGFVLDFKHPDFLPYIAIELFNWQMFSEEFDIDLGGTAGRVFLQFEWELLPIMKLGPTVWGGWNVPEKQYSAGIGFSIIKF